MNKQKQFDRYVASQPLVPYNVYGIDFSIQLDLQSVQEKGFSVILGDYVNEKKAIIDNGVAYIIPEYDKYQVNPKNFKKQKLLHHIREENFLAMMNQAEIVVSQDQGEKSAQYYFKISQDEIRKYNCMMIAALLIDSGLAKIGEKDSELYIVYNFQKKLERTSKIQSDLSRFRTLLGESNNLAALLEAVEKGDIQEDMLVINKEEIDDNELNIEMMSLMDVGLAHYKEDPDGKGSFELSVSFASWLLEYISNTSDRVSFGDLYTG